MDAETLLVVQTMPTYALGQYTKVFKCIKTVGRIMTAQEISHFVSEVAVKTVLKMMIVQRLGLTVLRLPETSRVVAKEHIQFLHQGLTA